MTDGEMRRMNILEILNNRTTPVSGTELAGKLGVSRQVIVQDIALLRADNKEIMSTYKGYILHSPDKDSREYMRVLRVNHGTEDTLDELQTIVDYGGRVLDVSVEHGLYGHITVDLIINNRLDASEFVAQMEQSLSLIHILMGWKKDMGTPALRAMVVRMEAAMK